MFSLRLGYIESKKNSCIIDAELFSKIINETSNLIKESANAMQSKDKEIVIDKSEYDNMKAPIVKNKRIIKNKPIDVELLLKKPDLLGSSKWEFIHIKKIEAKIEDEAFLYKVKEGIIKNLYAGVKIPCKLEYEYELDINSDPIPNSEKYIILEITGDVIEPEEYTQLNIPNQ